LKAQLHAKANQPTNEPFN